MSIITAIALHFIADFPMQPDFLAMNKGKSWEIMFYHCAVYTSLFVLFGATLTQAAIILSTHFIIDNLKARWLIVKHIWVDQLLHMIILAVLYV